METYREVTGLRLKCIDEDFKLLSQSTFLIIFETSI